MQRLGRKFTGLYDQLTKFPRAVLVTAVILAVSSLVYTAREMTFLTGRDDLMPKDTGFHVDYRAYRAEFGDPEEIVVVMEGEPQRVVAFGEELSRRLQGKRGIRGSFFPGGLPFFRENGLLYLSTGDLQKLRYNLTLLKPVLKDVSASPTVETLFKSVTGRMEHYIESASLAQDPASLIVLLKALGGGLEQYEKGGSAGMAGLLIGNDAASMGRLQVLTVMPVRDPASFVPAEEAIAAVRSEIAGLLKDDANRGVKAGLTGTPVLEYEEMATSRQDMNLALVVSLVLTVILLLISFRGVLNVVAAMTSLLIAISLSFGFATLVVGHLNILSMVFAVMLVGLGIEYGIQVVLRYQEELAMGAPDSCAIRTGLEKNIWSILMAAVTTAAAFLTFVFTDFKGIAELGIIAAGGVFICLLVTFTVLPALLILLAKYKRRVVHLERGGRGGSDQIKKSIFGRPGLVVAGAAFFLSFCGYFAAQVPFDYNLLNLQAKGLESVEYAYRLMADKQNPGYFAVASAVSADEARRKARAFEALPVVDHVVMLESLVPNDQSAKIQELNRIRSLLADIKPGSFEGELNPLALPQVFERFRNATERLRVKMAELGRPEEREVAAFLRKLDLFFATLEKNRDSSARGMLDRFQGEMLADLPAQLRYLKEELPSRPVTVADIPEELKSRFIGATGRYLLQIAPKERIFDREPLQKYIGGIREVDPHVTGEPVMVYESMTIMRKSYQWAFIYAFLAVIIILFITFRSVRYTFIGLSMLGAGVLVMVGAMGMLGLSFNSANIIVMPLILGIGIDSGIYIINRYRSEEETPEQVVMSSAGVGVVLNTLTILASFGALMVAHHRGVYSIGAVMSLGMVSCLVVFVVLLPAVLSLWGKKRETAAHGK